MKRARWALLVAVLLILCGMPNAVFAEGPPPGAIPFLQMTQVDLDASYFVEYFPDGLHWLMTAFVPTDAPPNNWKCLCSINAIGPANAVDLMWCEVKQHETYGWGVRVQLTFHAPYTPQNDERAIVTIMQEGARNYGDPLNLGINW